MSIKRFNDRMVTRDDIILTNKIEHQEGVAAPHGRLFEVVGHKGNRRMVRELACNTVVVGGAISALEYLTGATPTWRPATLNTIHNVTATPAGDPKLLYFGAGIGGANLALGSVIDPDIKQRDILSPVPMRYTEELEAEDLAKYRMKVDNGDGTFSWYLKKFTGSIVLKSCWKNSTDPDEDGTEITTEIYDSSDSTGIETFAEITIDFSTHDVREYFEATGSLSSARYNTIGFYTGADNAAGDEAADVRLYSAITFNNKSLDIRSRSSYIYRIYSLV